MLGSRVLDDLAEVIGEKKALDLAWEFRGERLYVPEDHTIEPRIQAAIGEQAARQLSDVFHKSIMPIPMTVPTERKVLQLVAQGQMTRREIARFVGIREARVYAILDKWRKRDEGLQPRLL